MSDRLIYNGDTLLFNPRFELPHNLVTEEEDTRSLNNILFGDRDACWNTACWRGYQLIWKIENSQLYLTEIYSCCYPTDSIKADLAGLFKEKAINGKVKADWVNGKNIAWNWNDLMFFLNEMRVVRQEFEFNFYKGRLLSIDTFDNVKSRRSAYSQNPEKLRKFIHSSINWDSLPEIQEPVRVFVQLSQVNEEGRITSARILRGSDNEIFNQEAVRVVKSIPEWDVIYSRGRLFPVAWHIPIVFSEENRERFRITEEFDNY